MKTAVPLEDAKASRAENLEYTRRNVRNTPGGRGHFASIRRKCLDCTAWQPSEIACCAMTDCALWPYRFGGDPWRKGNRSPAVSGKDT